MDGKVIQEKDLETPLTQEAGSTICERLQGIPVS